MGMRLDNRRCLGSVDKGGSEFSSLIDSESTVEKLPLFLGQGTHFPIAIGGLLTGRRRGCRSRYASIEGMYYASRAKEI